MLLEAGLEVVDGGNDGPETLDLAFVSGPEDLCQRGVEDHSRGERLILFSRIWRLSTLPNPPESHVRSAAHIIVIGEKESARQSEVDPAGIVLEVQLVGLGRSDCGNFAGVDAAGGAVPGSFAGEIEATGGF